MTASGGVGARWCCGDNEVCWVLQGSLQHNYEQWSNCSYVECVSRELNTIDSPVRSDPFLTGKKYVRYSRFEAFL